MIGIIIFAITIFAIAVIMAMTGRGGGNSYVPVLVAAGLIMHQAATTAQFILVAKPGREQRDSGKEATPGRIVRNAIDNRCQSIAYTYTEPTIFYEYAYDVAEIAHEKGLKNLFAYHTWLHGLRPKKERVRLRFLRVVLQ